MSSLISVVIPVWNRPDFLKLSVQSVLSQTYQNFEIIIVDDGSTDNTVSVANEICKKDPERIRLIRKEHSGATDTFNVGLQHIKGDVFCLLGSDDLWLPTKLGEQVKVHYKYPNHVLHTESFRIDVNGNPQKDIYKSNIMKQLGGVSPSLFFNRHLRKPYAAFFGSSLFVPVSVLSTMGKFSDTVGQDYHWVLRACLLHGISFTLIPKHLIKNRTNPRSTTCENNKYILKEAVKLWEDTLIERLKKYKGL